MHEKTVETKQGRFVIRPYVEQDEPKVLDLWSAAFGQEMAVATWRWKYLEGPFGHQILVCEAENGDLAAFYGGVPYPANFRGEDVRITQLTDNMSHPAYRGVIGGRTGLFVRTVLHFFDCFGGPHASVFLYGFPGRRHYVLGERMLGYRAFPGGARYMTGSPDVLRRGFNRFGGRLEVLQAPDQGFDRLTAALRDRYPLAVLRDSRFLRWRFCLHPSKNYELWAYRSFMGRRWAGYAVLSFQDSAATLVDLLLPAQQNTALDFLARVGGELVRRGVGSVQTWLPDGHGACSTMAAAGLSVQDEPIGMIPTGRTFHRPLAWDWAARNVYYTMADGDLF